MVTLWQRTPRLTGFDLARLTHDLSTMLTAEWGLPRALESLAKQAGKKKIGATYLAMAAELQGGKSFRESVENRRTIFGSFLCKAVNLGEEGGNLPVVLEHCAEYFEKNTAFHLRAVRTLKFPLLMLSCSLGIMLAILAYLLMLDIRNNNALSNWLTGTAHGTASNILSVLYLVFIAIVTSFIGYFTLKTPFIGKKALSLSPLRNILRQNSLRHFFTAFSALVSGGVEIPRAMEAAAETVSDTPLYRKLLRIMAGRSGTMADLIAGLRSEAVLPSLTTGLLDDLKSGRPAEELFGKIAEFYQEEMESRLTVFAIMMGPAAIILTGIIGTGLLLLFSPPLARILGSG